MKTSTLIFAVLGLLLIGCQGAKSVEEAKADSLEAGFLSFGEQITSKNAIGLPKLLDKMEVQDSVATKLRGKVEAVCQAKGCWMNIVSEDGKEIFVKFKDYGFFMPLDCAGKEVIMDGYAYKEVTSVDELRHYAEDNGDTPEQIASITEPKEELKFLASGVLLVDK